MDTTQELQEQQEIAEVEINNDQGLGSKNSSLIFIWSLFGFILLGLFIYGIVTKKIKLGFKRQLNYEKSYSSNNKHDEKRKSDLKQINVLVTKFIQENSVLPSKEQFAQIAKSFKDPLQGKDTPVQLAKFGYYYQNNQDSYKIWCYLENPTDSEASQNFNGLASMYAIEEEIHYQVPTAIPTTPQIFAEPAHRDQKRKQDLAQIQLSLQNYYQAYQKYPNQNEFELLLSNQTPSTKDPRKGEPTGHGNFVYDYYYDNRNTDTPGKLIDNNQIYRIYCFLENLNDPQIAHQYDKNFQGLYILTNPIARLV